MFERVSNIAAHLMTLGCAQHIQVFGSAARNDGAVPADLDVFIDLRTAPHARELGRLLALCRIYYGELDAFVITADGQLLVRDEHARTWAPASNARELLAAMQKDAQPLATIAAALQGLAQESANETPAGDGDPPPRHFR